MLSKTVKVTWQRGTCAYYKSLGYKFTHIGDEFEINVEELKSKSRAYVDVLCDYCLEEGIENIISKKYCDYNKGRKYIEKDSCIKCQGKKEREVNLVRFGVPSTACISEIKEKQKETLMKNYGVDNPFSINDIQEKIKRTNLERYGVEYYTQTEEYKERAKLTSLGNWGTEYPMQSEEIKQKAMNKQIEIYGMHYTQTEEYKEKVKTTNIKKYGVVCTLHNPIIKKKVIKTNLERYGVEHNSQSELIKEKKKQTCLKNWGCEYASQNEEIKQRVKDTSLKNWGTEYPMQNEEIKARNVSAMYKHGTTPTSKQQKYLFDLIGGELNYPVSYCSLDIAFPNEMIYIEYNGSGHNIDVKYNIVTEEEFKIKEMKRYYYLRSLGWRMIEINSKKDKLPSDEVLLHIINQAKKYINSGHSWINIDLSSNIIKCSQFEITYNFKEIINFSS